MSVINPTQTLHIRLQMTRSTLDRLFGFLTGVISTGLIAFLVGITFVEPVEVTPTVAAVVIFAMLSILLLRGVPIDRIRLNKSGIKIDFEVTDNQMTKETKGED